MNTSDHTSSSQKPNPGAPASASIPLCHNEPSGAPLYAFPVEGNALTEQFGYQRLSTDMPAKSSKKLKRKASITKGISFDEPLYRATLHQAQIESRSFAFIVRRAIQRDLDAAKTARDIVAPQSQDELMDIHEVGQKLRLSVWTVRRRARKRGDPLRAAKSRLGKQKPMQFIRSKIEDLERKLSHAA